MMKKYLLDNNKEIPSIGFGTWKLKNNDSTIEVIKTAIKIGYRHFDTAFAYGNEEKVGVGIKDANIDRNELFITGKLWNADRGYDNIINACKRTIKNLDCEYLDLYLIHWPASIALYPNWSEINNETWKAFEYLYKEGLVKAIGVCNFKVHHLEELIKEASILPMVNQIEFHPGFMQKEILEYCKEKNILVEAWSPLASGKVFKNELLNEIAKKYNVSISQLCIKWCLQNGVLPLPKSKTEERMIENINLPDFTIDESDMNKINNMEYMGSGLDSDTLTLFN